VVAHPRSRAQDKALVQELCYGTLRRLGPLRATVKKLLTRPAADLQLEALLWVALYQLRHTSAPPRRDRRQRSRCSTRLQVTSAKGLVNAVLRFYLRNRAAIDAEPPVSDEARYSHPQWWIDLLRKEYPADWTRSWTPPIRARR
jgi:16S rRNA (cytosine967-C5)-methyltransferase